MTKRKTQGKRLTAKLKSLREEARRRMHMAVSDQQQWLCQVLRGHHQYYGLPSNFRWLNAFYLTLTCGASGSERSTDGANAA